MARVKIVSPSLVPSRGSHCRFWGCKGGLWSPGGLDCKSRRTKTLYPTPGLWRVHREPRTSGYHLKILKLLAESRPLVEDRSLARGVRVTLIDLFKNLLYHGMRVFYAPAEMMKSSDVGRDGPELIDSSKTNKIHVFPLPWTVKRNDILENNLQVK